jgi:alkanesulfonate monooxygenase SsuD/methylene tetrahydromethanopterin reductase-like flavin-dependent oxidoreductase (luciferase family)
VERGRDLDAEVGVRVRVSEQIRRARVEAREPWGERLEAERSRVRAGGEGDERSEDVAVRREDLLRALAQEPDESRAGNRVVGTGGGRPEAERQSE